MYLGINTKTSITLRTEPRNAMKAEDSSLKKKQQTLTLLHLEWLKFFGVLAILCAKELRLNMFYCQNNKNKMLVLKILQ